MTSIAAQNQSNEVPQYPIRVENSYGTTIYMFDYQNTTIMMRKKDCYVNATQILKALGINKNDRFHLLSEEIQKYPHEKITGGYAAYQGTWIPLKSARSLALALNVLPQLAPLFDYDVNSGLAESNHRLLVKYRRRSSDTLDSAETVTNSLNQSESNMQYKGNATEQYYNAGYPWVYPSPRARPFRPVPRPAMIPNVSNSPQLNQHRQTDIHNANFRPVMPMYYRPFPIPHHPPQGHPLNYHPYYNSPQNVNAPSPYKSPDIHFQKKLKIDRSQLVSSPPNKLRAEEVTSQSSSPAKENCQSSNNDKGLGMCKSCNNTMSVAILAIPCGHSFCDNCLLKIQRGASNSSKMICPCCQKPVELHVRNLALEEVLKKDKNASKSPELVETNVLEDPVQLAQKYQEQLDMIDKRLVNLEKETGEIEINMKDKLSKLEKSKSVIKKAEDGISKITANIEQLKNRLETLDDIVQENLPIQNAIEKSIQNYQSRMIDLSHEKSALTERKEKVYGVWKGLGNISQ